MNSEQIKEIESRLQSGVLSVADMGALLNEVKRLTPGEAPQDQIILSLNHYQARNLLWLLQIAINGVAYPRGAIVASTEQPVYLNTGDWNGELIYMLANVKYSKQNSNQPLPRWAVEWL